MDQGKALQVLIEGINAAQQRGAYTLEEAGALLHAVSAFTRPIQTTNKKPGAPGPQKPVQKTEPSVPAEQEPEAKPEKRGSFFGNGLGVK